MKIFVACKFHQMRSLASFWSSGSGLASSFLVTPLCRRREALHITLLYAAFSAAAAISIRAIARRAARRLP